MKSFFCLTSFLLGLGTLSATTPEQLEFFESRIRPILAQECYECHSVATKSRGDLLLDSRTGWQAGGESGPSLIPGNPDASLLLQTLRHEHPDLKMPKNGAQLDPAILADFARWIADGAADPRDEPPSADQTKQDQAWPAVLERRKQWWAFQPLQKPILPTTSLTASIDHLIDQKLREQNLAPSPKAPPHLLQRRLSYLLTGLPPTATTPTDVPQLIDHLLSSPAYGEKWARHWMDWLRYAETHGSEGDPAIPHAWRYRDYLIRALNADVPYQQILREHIAGDLLPNPRLDPKLKLNESALATAHYRMVLHGFTPTDPTDELATTTDNQIDTVTKAFLGVTVSCARCHNHKFDALSQADFYALYGVFASSKPALIDVSADPQRPQIQAQLQALKTTIQNALAHDWQTTSANKPPPIPEHLTASQWQTDRTAYQAALAAEKKFLTQPAAVSWSAPQASAPLWHIDASSPTTQVHSPGSFSLLPSGDEALHAILPAGIHSHLLSDRDRAVLISSRFPSQGGRLFARVAGSGGARARFVVQNYPRRGTVYPKTDLTDPTPKWITWKLDYFKGDSVHIELTTEADQPVETTHVERSHFTLTDVVYLPHADDDIKPPKAPGPPPLAALLPADTAAPTTPEAFTNLHRQATLAVLTRWTQNQASPSDAAFLDHLLQSGYLPNTLERLPAAAPLIQRYRQLEAQLSLPVRAPGVLEADAFDQPLYVRGDHKQPAEPIARRFLDAIDPTPFQANRESGRLQLAESMLAPANPLTWRVIANRVWHHLFGQGLVTTPDNFGRLGEPPSHPELLDLLALHVRDHGGSLKELIRAIVASETFQRSSRPATQSADPKAQTLLAHYPIQRLDAEAIRDSLLSLSGQLKLEPFGPPVTGDQPRRSVYVRVIRNQLDTLLNTFDAPVPSSTRGRRDTTNVPAQSLALLNDPTVIQWTHAWADTLLADPSLSSDAPRVTQLFRQAFNRAPSTAELQSSLAYLQQTRTTAEADLTADTQTRKKVAALQAQLSALISQAQPAAAVTPHPTPQPLAEWAFTNGPSDLQGQLDLELHGGAKIEQGALVLDGKGAFASTPPLPVSLTAKTLEVWLTLADLTQRGGGAITLQNRDGGLFDSIVFAEKSLAQWVAGSNNFLRSEPFDGPSESEAAQRIVHLAVTYAPDGTVTGYRDGQPYGHSIHKAPLATFAAEQSQLLLGCRHGKPSGNRLLKSRIHRARLYDRALTAEEIRATSQLEPRPLTEADLLATLPSTQRDRYQSLQQELKALQATLAPTPPASPDQQALRALCQSLINLKEFIYLR